MKFLLIILGLSSFVLPSAAIPAIWCVSPDYEATVCSDQDETITASLATELNNEIQAKNITTNVVYGRNLRGGVDERELQSYCNYCQDYWESWCVYYCPSRRLQESSTEELPCKVTCADLVNDALNELNRLSNTVAYNTNCSAALEAATCHCEE
jgi:hypothetical protein